MTVFIELFSTHTKVTCDKIVIYFIQGGPTVAAETGPPDRFLLLTKFIVTRLALLGVD